MLLFMELILTMAGCLGHLTMIVYKRVALDNMNVLLFAWVC